jgi:hypothetical protein
LRIWTLVAEREMKEKCGDSGRRAAGQMARWFAKQRRRSDVRESGKGREGSDENWSCFGVGHDS